MAKVYTPAEEAQISEYQAKMFSQGGKQLRVLAGAKSGLKRVAAQREITRRADKRAVKAAAREVLTQAVARSEDRLAGVEYLWDENDLLIVQ